ncbi:MAG: tetratricopeptide repeat protein [Gemmatimonadetes bacterium]|nr:tetratricopeptide repeat protein [Gemmatimonadota bacterium]
MRSITVVLLTVGLSGRNLCAQSAAEFVAAGDSLAAALRPDLALPRYGAAAARDSTLYVALWKAGRAAVDVAKQIETDDERSRATRGSLYRLARDYAERAIRMDSTGADGHFVLALALGRLARTSRGRERVRFGRVIYQEAARAIALRPDHDGAHHILGAWHAEARRLSAVERFFARLLLGAGFLSMASRDSAVTHLARAVKLNPGYIYHRLELAEVYVDLGRYQDAREQLLRMADVPDSDVMDGRYRARAAQLINEIAARER